MNRTGTETKPTLKELEAIGAGPELDRLVAEMEEQRAAKAGTGSKAR
jgi:hypothetical protein